MRPTTPVHPHIRGAYRFVIADSPGHNGSSPHTWGIRTEFSYSPCCARFIPTYVGHTIRHSTPTKKPPVHPHIRGAYCWGYMAKHLVAGSSPHTWGIHARYGARPGNYPVHPHIRGAYDKRPPYDPANDGSSPHTWGIHWPAVRKMAGFSHFSYDFTQKSYFVQGLVFFGVIGAEAFPTQRRGRSQCLSGSHGGSARNL